MRSVRLIGPGNSGRDLLQAEVDQPDVTQDNVGVLSGVARPNVFSSDITINTDDTVYSNATFNCRVKIQAARARFYNCLFAGNASPPASNTNLVECTHANCVDAYFEDCSVIPGTPSKRWQIGIAGHDYILNRVYIDGSVDGLNIFKSGVGSGYQTNVQAIQCEFGNLGYWTASATNDVHPSDRITHNDAIQHMGGGGTLIRGCTVKGYYRRQYAHWQSSNYPTEPYAPITLNSLADGGPWFGIPDRNIKVPGSGGTLANGRYNTSYSSTSGQAGSLASLMIGDDVGYSFDLRVYGNWFYGGEFCINGGGNANPGGGVSLGQFYRNKFARDMGNQGSGGDPMTLNCQGGGWSAATVDAPTSGANANVYMDTGLPILPRY
jgi:hypothetical protein